jgi:hypothetical protein
MSRTTRPSKGISPNTFADAVVTAVEQILAARGFSGTQSSNVQFAISPALAQPNVLDYSSGTGAKIFTKVTEALKTPFSIKNPNMKLLLNEIQVRSESFGWNNLFNITIENEDGNATIKNLLTTHGQCSIHHIQRESSQYVNTTTRKRQNNYQLLYA